MGELVARLTQGQYQGTPEPARTLVLYTTPLFWGSKVIHSEVLSADDILKFVDTGGVDRSRVTKLWLIIVTQYNSCDACKAYVRTTSVKVALQAGVSVVPGLWQLTAYIDGYDSNTWVAPQSPKDITRVPLS